MGPVDSVDRVIYRSVRDGKAAGGMGCCRLGSGCSDDNQERFIPFYHLAHWFRRLGSCGRDGCGSQHGTVTPVRIGVFISDLVQVDESVSGHLTRLKRTGDQQLFPSRLGESAVVVRIGTATKCDLFPAVRYGAG